MILRCRGENRWRTAGVYRRERGARGTASPYTGTRHGLHAPVSYIYIFISLSIYLYLRCNSPLTSPGAKADTITIHINNGRDNGRAYSRSSRLSGTRPRVTPQIDMRNPFGGVVVTRNSITIAVIVVVRIIRFSEGGEDDRDEEEQDEQDDEEQDEEEEVRGVPRVHARTYINAFAFIWNTRGGERGWVCSRFEYR